MRKIFLKNILTIFNLVNIILAIMVIAVGSYKNLLFIVIAIANTLISIINELRAKKIVDNLRIMAEKPVQIKRGEQELKVPSDKLLVGDIIILQKGDQLAVDAKIVSGEPEINESFLTGEADNIKKKPGDKLLSGSYLANGSCEAKVTAVGDELTIKKIEQSAKAVKDTKSKLFQITNNIVKYISYALIPIGALLLWSRYRVDGTTPEIATTTTVAALINMIPEGLILLISSVLALSTIRLSKKKVLVQDLYAIETLARVDTICLDKTGTLTTVKDGKETVRPESKKLIEYFKKNDVEAKIISGDDFETVKNVAEKVGIENPRILNLENVTIKELRKVANDYNVFAKANPEQKQTIAKALHDQNHIIAMTGDGVNDVLAMREADCSISVADGTDVARRTAKLVLLNSDFSTIPDIINEGRQTINNLERSATLFLTKTFYAGILAVIFAIVPITYPFIPIEMSLLNFLCIGFPAFVLALETNHERIQDKFLKNIKKYSIPTGIIIAVLIITLSIVSQIFNLDYRTTTVLSSILVFVPNITMITIIAKPLNKYRIALITIIIAMMAATLLIPFANQIFFSL